MQQQAQGATSFADTLQKSSPAYGRFMPYFSVTGMLQELSVKKMELWQADQQPSLTEHSTEVEWQQPAS